MSIVKKPTNLKRSILSRQQCFEQTEQPVKMVLRFAQQQKIQLSEMREPYFFYAQSISKDICAKHLHKIFDNNYATYSLVFATSQTIFTDFFGSLKTGENLAFLKTKRTKKFPLSISVSDWRLSYNVPRLHVRCGQFSEKVKAKGNFPQLSTFCRTQNPAMACSRCCRMAIGILKKCRA